MVQDGASGIVALARTGHGHAGGRNVAVILSWIELPAKLTIHSQVKDGLLLIRGALLISVELLKHHCVII